MCELWNEIPSMEASFKLELHSRGGNSRTIVHDNTGKAISYEQQYWKHIDVNFQGKLRSFREYQQCNVGVKCFQEYGILGKITSWVQTHGVHDKSIPNSTVIANIHSLVTVVSKNFEGFHSPLEIECLLFEAVKFFVKSMPSSSQRLLPDRFLEHWPEDILLT